VTVKVKTAWGVYKWKTPPPPKTEVPPGRVRAAIRRKRARVAKATAPYVLAYGAALVLVMIASLLLGVTPLPGMFFVLGAALAHAVIRLHEASGWHRDGGKAAQRKRRRFQGPATMRELHRRLGLRAARRNAAIMRPSLGGRTRRLPPEEAGVFIGTARRSVR
jgi:hypothetical protein